MGGFCLNWKYFRYVEWGIIFVKCDVIYWVNFNGVLEIFYFCKNVLGLWSILVFCFYNLLGGVRVGWLIVLNFILW